MMKKDEVAASKIIKLVSFPRTQIWTVHEFIDAHCIVSERSSDSSTAVRDARRLTAVLRIYPEIARRS
jgi:hypothetical protein